VKRNRRGVTEYSKNEIEGPIEQKTAHMDKNGRGGNVDVQLPPHHVNAEKLSKNGVRKGR